MSLLSKFRSDFECDTWTKFNPSLSKYVLTQTLMYSIISFNSSTVIINYCRIEKSRGTTLVEILMKK